MPKELIISANAHEKKVAIIEDGVVTEFYVERTDENTGVVGNIYKGRVMKVLPGMQSAFVDIGLERDAFLYVSDFLDVFEEDAIEVKEEERRVVDERAPKAQRPERPEPAPAERPEPRPEPRQAAPAEEAEAEQQEQEGAGRRRRRRRRRGGEAQRPGLDEYDSPQAAEVADDEGYAVEDRAYEMLSDAATDIEEANIAADFEDDDVYGLQETGRYPETAQPDSERHAPTTEELDDDPYAVPSAQSEGLVFEIVRDEELPHRARAYETAEALETAADQEAESKRGRSRKSRSKKAAAEPAVAAEPAKPKRGARKVVPTEVAVEEAAQEEAEPKKGRSRKSRSKKAAAGPEPVFERVVDDEAPAAPAQSARAPEVIEASVTEDPDAGREYRVGDLKSQLSAAPEGLQRIGDDEAPVDLAEDADAEVADDETSARMATRRGGRGRRRRPGGEEERGEGERGEGERGERGERERERERGRDREPAAAKTAAAPGNGRGRREPLISDLLHEGQEVIVQIAKEPIAKKGARITSHLVLPGRFLVFMPTVTHVGVSRKIQSDSERVRLKKVVQGIKERDNIPGGFIARTAAIGQTDDDLRDDMLYLVRTWTDIRRDSERRKAPALLHRDLDLIQRILRDQMSDDFTAIRIDSEDEYARIVDFVHRVQPSLVRRVKLHTRDEPILEAYGVQAEIDKAVKPRVWLKSGGYIVINQTEALVAIDINTGKFVGKSDRLEDTITRTNLEAVKEIVRQIRLRDLGGIIVIDFIDMEERRNRQRVMQALEAELKEDKSPSKILAFNDFGLVAITRKRVRQSLERTLCSPCHYCQGAGLVKSAQTMAFEILSEARRAAKQVDSTAGEVMLRVSPEVAQALRTTDARVFDEIEAHFSVPVSIKADPELHQEQFDFAIL